ncbi:hypothetical protein EJ04DRAFT_527694 [Polyplosphaeria fusca]|uniref:Uncharacterized protein n=1 Tax=Polyplosphaeria fusca TaxID=682080 RepID=A0A9P4QNG5_9PLEO|nr:hypothetical protein EJ04DRAFT_527694 [Polyplosphaeria fusca]
MRLIAILLSSIALVTSLPTIAPPGPEPTHHFTPRDDPLPGPPGTLSICLEPRFKSCTTVNAFHKCVDFSGDNAALNKKMSSFKAAPGAKCTFYRAPNCNAMDGYNATMTDDSTELGDVGGDWNDQISSVRCIYDADAKLWYGGGRKRALGARSLTSAPEIDGPVGSIDLCVQNGFKGCTLVDALGKCVDFRGWDALYKKVDSLRVTKNTRCAFFEGDGCDYSKGYEGKTTQHKTWNNLSKTRWNNRIASVQCWDRKDTETWWRND